MKKISHYFKSIGFSVLLFCLSNLLNAQTLVCMQSNMGEICIKLFPESAPKNVDNFLRYVENELYNGTIVHRSVPGFIIQGGGFIMNSNISVTRVSQFDPVENEFTISNTRGTVAMAKLSGDPDSATNQWFINLADNSENLDFQNNGFTVIGEVTEQSMPVVDEIAALSLINFGGTLSSTPVIDFDNSDLTLDTFVTIDTVAIKEVDEAPVAAQDPVAQYSDGLLHFAVDAGQHGFLSLSLQLIAVTPQLQFRLLPETISQLTALPEVYAHYDELNEQLTIDSVAVAGQDTVYDVLMTLTEGEGYTFSVVAMSNE